MDEKKFKCNLKSIRQNKGLTLVQLEEKTGISKTQLQKMETGERSIPSDSLAILCNALGVDPMSLLGIDNYDFQVAEVFSDADIEFLRLMKELDDNDREQLEMFISFLIYQHKSKLHEVGGQ